MQIEKIEAEIADIMKKTQKMSDRWKDELNMQASQIIINKETSSTNNNNLEPLDDDFSDKADLLYNKF